MNTQPGPFDPPVPTTPAAHDGQEPAAPAKPKGRPRGTTRKMPVKAAAAAPAAPKASRKPRTPKAANGPAPAGREITMPFALVAQAVAGLSFDETKLLSQMVERIHTVVPARRRAMFAASLAKLFPDT